MILLIDPEVSYLDISKAILESRGYDVVIAEDYWEVTSLCFDFKDDINVILFDSSRIETNPELLDALQFSQRYGGTAGVPWVEWSLPFWTEIQRLEVGNKAVTHRNPVTKHPLQPKGKPQ